MVLIEIQLIDEQAIRLKELAERRGISLEALIRDGIAKILQENDDEGKWRRASLMIGRFSGTSDDVAVNHDAYLEEAYL